MYANFVPVIFLFVLIICSNEHREVAVAACHHIVIDCVEQAAWKNNTIREKFWLLWHQMFQLLTLVCSVSRNRC